MSVHISVSINEKNNNNNKCNEILQKLIKHDINCRSINIIIYFSL